MTVTGTAKQTRKGANSRRDKNMVEEKGAEERAYANLIRKQEYEEKEYWDKRYLAAKGTFDWYTDYQTLEVRFSSSFAPGKLRPSASL